MLCFSWIHNNKRYVFLFLPFRFCFPSHEYFVCDNQTAWDQPGILCHIRHPRTHVTLLESCYSTATQILSLKVVCNMFASPQGYAICMGNKDKLISTALNLKTSQNKNVQIGLGTILLIISVGMIGPLDLEGKTQILATCAEMMKAEPDNGAALILRGNEVNCWLPSLYCLQ